MLFICKFRKSIVGRTNRLRGLRFWDPHGLRNEAFMPVLSPGSIKTVVQMKGASICKNRNEKSCEVQTSFYKYI